MHEIGLCESVMEAVRKRAAGRQVTGVTLRVGAGHRVVTASMEQAFELVSAGSVAEGAVLTLVGVDGNELTLESITVAAPEPEGVATDVPRNSG